MDAGLGVVWVVLTVHGELVTNVNNSPLVFFLFYSICFN